jgi:hypothetical protein
MCAYARSAQFAERKLPAFILVEHAGLLAKVVCLIRAPLVAIVKVICDRVEALKPVAELLWR